MSNEVTNIEHLRNWLRDCPALSKKNRFRVDYLAESPTEYALYSVPTTIAYRENVLGEEVPREIQTLDFIFASKEQYGSDARQNATNLGFYDSVIGWIIEQNSSRNFPEINEGQIKSIVPTLTQYVADADSDSAKYQIQIKVTYRRR